MAERQKRSPQIESIYTRVAGRNADIREKLGVVESYFRTIAQLPLDQRSQIAQPPELDFPLFSQASQLLGNRNPLMVLRAALAEEEWKAERRELTTDQPEPEVMQQPRKRVRRPIVEIPLPEDRAEPSTEPTALPATPDVVTRAARKTTKSFTPPQGYIRGSTLVSRFSDMPRSLVKATLQSLPSVGTTAQGVFYSEAEAIRVLTAAWEKRAQENEARSLRRIAKAREHSRRSGERAKARRRERRESTRPLPEWARTKILAAEYGIGLRIVTRLLSGVPTQKWDKATYYDRTVAEPILQAYRATLSEEGIYVRNKKNYVHIFYLSKRFNLSFAKIKKELDGLPTLTETSPRPVTLYPLDEALAKIDHLIVVPEANKQTGIYSDAKGLRWAPKTVVQDVLHISERSLPGFLEEAPHQDIRDRSGKLTLGYNLEAIQQQVSVKFADTINLDPETRQGVDPEGNIYVTQLEAKLRLGLRSSKPITRVIEDGTITIRHVTGKKPGSLRTFDLYSLEDLRRAFGRSDE